MTVPPRLVASGVCHTDTTMSKGLLPGAEFPIILGMSLHVLWYFTPETIAYSQLP